MPLQATGLPGKARTAAWRGPSLSASIGRAAIASFDPAAKRAARLLVAHGEPTARARAAAILGALGEVVAATSVDEALAALAEGPVDLLVVGERLADASAPDACRDLRVEAPGRPVVLLHGARAARATGAHVLDERTALEQGELARVAQQLLARSRPGEIEAERLTHARALLGALEEGVIVYSPTGRIVAANARALALLGLEGLGSLPTRAGENGFAVFGASGDRLGPGELPYAIALRTGAPTAPVDVRMRRADGVLRWFAATARPLVRAGEDAPYAAVCTFRDVTDERALLTARLDAERRQHLLIEHAVEGYLVLAPDGRVLETSPSIGRYWPTETILGADGVSLVAEEDRAAAGSLFLGVADGGGAVVRAELRVRDARRTLRWVEVTLVNRVSEPSIGGIVVNIRDITERKLAEESMARLSAIVESSDSAIVSEALDGTITSWNRAADRLFGCRAADAVGSFLGDVVPVASLGDLDAARERIAAGERLLPWEAEFRRKDGTDVAIVLTASPIFDAAGALAGTSWNARDITERRRLDAARRAAEERFRLGFEHGAIGMAMMDAEYRLTRVNPALVEMIGRPERELLGRRLDEFVADGSLSSPVAGPGGSGPEHYRGDQRFARADGSIVWAHLDVVVVRAEPGAAPYLFAQLQDITDRKRSEAALAHQALHDALTGLPNRALLADRLSQALRRSARGGGGTAVLFCDIDRFKLVNDGLGHAAGDRLLVDIAQRLVAGVRASDTVARFGGDEFIVVCEEVASAAQAEALGNQLNALFSAPFVVDGKQLYVTASCGVVLVGPGASAEEALRDADAAMYRAKERGRARIEVFDEALRAEVAARFELDRELRFALERDELRVVYQPIIEMPTGRLVGAEALVRWLHPERGLVLPAQFIAAAEDSGIVERIGAFVVETALAELGRWRRELPVCEDLSVSVNLSSLELAQGNPVALCASALAAAGLEPGALRIELTESSVMGDVDASIDRLVALRDLGVTVVVDDFGTGYSSLSYLSRLPVGALKIDKSFVAGLGADGSGSAIVRAIVGLAASMHLELCAEGVERVEQRDALIGLGCEFGQGHLFAPPLGPREFSAWVRRAGAARGPGRLDAIARFGDT